MNLFLLEDSSGSSNALVVSDFETTPPPRIDASWFSCLQSNLLLCSDSQARILQNVQKHWLQFFKTGGSKSVYDRNSNFFHTCATHCESLDPKIWLGLKVKGVSLRDAVEEWWQNGGVEERRDGREIFGEWRWVFLWVFDFFSLT